MHFQPHCLLSYLSVSAEQEFETSRSAACFADTEASGKSIAKNVKANQLAGLFHTGL